MGTDCFAKFFVDCRGLKTLIATLINVQNISIAVLNYSPLQIWLCSTGFWRVPVLKLPCTLSKVATQVYTSHLWMNI